MNRKTILIHAAWCLTAASTFVLGLAIARSSRGPAGEGDGGQGGLVVAPGVLNRPGTFADARRDAAGGGSSNGAAGESGAGAGPRVLTPLQIEDLAREAFMDASHLKRSLAFSKLLESLTPENVGLVREALESMNAGGDQWRLFRYAWGSIDGPGAMEHASTLEGRQRAEFVGEALSGWASSDPAAAMRWLDAMEPGDEQQRLRGSLVAGLADHDTRLATDYVFRLASEGDNNASRYLEQVAGEEMRTRGVRSAATWAESLPDGDLKGAALDQIAGRYVGEDPEAAATWATKFAGESFGARVIEEVGDEWAERDPQAAVGWLETLPDARGKEEGMQSALSEWTRRDPVAASEYLVAMPASPTKDHAVDGFARRLSYEDPVSALAWAETIGNDQMRVEAVTRAAQQWFRRDAESAAEWLSTSGLPPEAQEAVVNPPRDRDRWRRGG